MFPLPPSILAPLGVCGFGPGPGPGLGQFLPEHLLSQNGPVQPAWHFAMCGLMRWRIVFSIKSSSFRWPTLNAFAWKKSPFTDTDFPSSDSAPPLRRIATSPLMPNSTDPDCDLILTPRWVCCDEARPRHTTNMQRKIFSIFLGFDYNAV